MSRWPSGTSGAAQILSGAVIFFVSPVVGVLALNLAAALVEQRANIAQTCRLRIATLARKQRASR